MGKKALQCDEWCFLFSAYLWLTYLLLLTNNDTSKNLKDYSDFWFIFICINSRRWFRSFYLKQFESNFICHLPDGGHKLSCSVFSLHRCHDESKEANTSCRAELGVVIFVFCLLWYSRWKINTGMTDVPPSSIHKLIFLPSVPCETA